MNLDKEHNPATTFSRLNHGLQEIGAETIRALELFPPFNSSHEGYAVILEELDELWEEVKRSDRDKDTMRREAVQVAAMALRFVMECTE